MNALKSGKKVRFLQILDNLKEDSKRKIINDILLKVVGLSLEPLHFKADLVEHTTCVNQTAASRFGGMLYKVWWQSIHGHFRAID